MPRTHADQLLSPLVEYRRIGFRDKSRFGWGVPLLVGIPVGAIAFFFPAFNVAGERGLVDSTLSLLALLVGFYTAALGVAVTASDPYLDDVPEDRPPVVRINGTEEEISWRRFLAALFAHLVAVSFVAYLLGAGIMVGAPFRAIVAGAIGPEWGNVTATSIRAFSAGLYSLLLCHLFITTFFGIFLMAQRLPEVREDYLDRQRPSAPPSRPSSVGPTKKKGRAAKGSSEDGA